MKYANVYLVNYLSHQLLKCLRRPVLRILLKDALSVSTCCSDSDRSWELHLEYVEVSPIALPKLLYAEVLGEVCAFSVIVMSTPKNAQIRVYVLNPVILWINLHALRRQLERLYRIRTASAATSAWIVIIPSDSM